MSDTINDLENLGVDATRAIERFCGNSELYLKFLNKFPDEKTFAELVKVVQEGDLKSAENAAHTLKGVAANLGLNCLATKCNDYILSIRAGAPDDSMYDDLVTEYDKAVFAIKSIAGGC